MGLEKISILKKEKGLTNAQLSKLSGVPLGTLDKITSGVTTDPKLETLKALCKVLDCTLDDLDDSNKPILKRDENKLLESYRLLDDHGKQAINSILNVEIKRMTQNKAPNDNENENVIYIEYYRLPVSAGTGVYLDNSDKEMMQVPFNKLTAKANFALRVSGDSMEPQYYDGDVILIKSQPCVELGELGIFILNNEGYFKKCGEGELISLNSKYDPIQIKEFDSLVCKGKVIGKL